MRLNEAARIGSVLFSALTVGAGPLGAEVCGSDLMESWKPRVELISTLLQDDPPRIISSHTVTFTAEGSGIVFTGSDGSTTTLELAGGRLSRDGKVIGRYPAGGALESAWRELASALARETTPRALGLVRAWRPEGLSASEAAYAKVLRESVEDLSAPADGELPPQDVAPAAAGGLIIDLRDLSDPERLAPALRAAALLRGEALRITVPGGRARSGHFSVGSSERIDGGLLVVHGNADIFGTVVGNVATVEGDVILHPGGVVTGDVLAVAGTVRDLGGDVRGHVRTLDAPRHTTDAAVEAPPLPPLLRVARNGAGVLGVFLSLLAVGFGLVTFARPPLEVVSDTVMHSFSRALLVGLLGQVLVLPTFGMLVVGLVLSVAGIVLVPFAVIVFALLLVAAILGGFLAVAHAMGETLTRRQLARGVRIASANSYRYVATGLAGLAGLWSLWAIFGPIPFAGVAILSTAALSTWLLATVGFGAALLSRAGMREHFAGRILPAESLTDEYLWATPQFGVTAVKRPEKSTIPPARRS